MYAIIEDSGTQLRVRKDDVISVDLHDLPESQSTLEFDKVLLIGDTKKPKIGRPYVEGAKVTAELIEQYRDRKVMIQKIKRRKGYRRLKGHRQDLMKVKITDIQG